MSISSGDRRTPAPRRSPAARCMLERSGRVPRRDGRSEASHVGGSQFESKGFPRNGKGSGARRGVGRSHDQGGELAGRRCSRVSWATRRASRTRRWVNAKADPLIDAVGPQAAPDAVAPAGRTEYRESVLRQLARLRVRWSSGPSRTERGSSCQDACLTRVWGSTMGRESLSAVGDPHPWRCHGSHEAPPCGGGHDRRSSVESPTAPQVGALGSAAGTFVVGLLAAVGVTGPFVSALTLAVLIATFVGSAVKVLQEPWRRAGRRLRAAYVASVASCTAL